MQYFRWKFNGWNLWKQTKTSGENRFQTVIIYTKKYIIYPVLIFVRPSPEDQFVNFPYRNKIGVNGPPAHNAYMSAAYFKSDLEDTKKPVL